jgi:tetratricopeptide (TPR) repeat protein
VANLALATGDYSRSYRLLREWRKSGTAASEGTFTWFLTLVGDYGNARSAGLRALNRAMAVRNDRYVAVDMLHLANAAQHLGRTAEALDWLSRALRLTQGSDLDAFALEIAADIALQNRLPGIATLLLDQVITSVDETVWDANGASILLLYGKVLERRGDATIADLVYQAAAERGRRERGSALITADSVRADLAARRGDMALALKLSKEAFCTVLDGRSRIGQEYYKPSFIAIPQSVGAQYLRLHAKAGARPHCDRMEGMSRTE